MNYGYDGGIRIFCLTRNCSPIFLVCRTREWNGVHHVRAILLLNERDDRNVVRVCSTPGKWRVRSHHLRSVSMPAHGRLLVSRPPIGVDAPVLGPPRSAEGFGLTMRHPTWTTPIPERLQTWRLRIPCPPALPGGRRSTPGSGHRPPAPRRPRAAAPPVRRRGTTLRPEPRPPVPLASAAAARWRRDMVGGDGRIVERWIDSGDEQTIDTGHEGPRVRG